MTILRKICTASILAIALASVPMHLAAQEREAAPEVRASVLGWFSSLWTDLASWFAQEVVPLPPPPESASSPDGRCTVDPNGNPICTEGQ